MTMLSSGSSVDESMSIMLVWLDRALTCPKMKSTACLWMSGLAMLRKLTRHYPFNVATTATDPLSNLIQISCKIMLTRIAHRRWRAQCPIRAYAIDQI